MRNTGRPVTMMPSAASNIRWYCGDPILRKAFERSIAARRGGIEGYAVATRLLAVGAKNNAFEITSGFVLSGRHPAVRDSRVSGNVCSGS